MIDLALFSLRSRCVFYFLYSAALTLEGLPLPVPRESKQHICNLQSSQSRACSPDTAVGLSLSALPCPNHPQTRKQAIRDSPVVIEMTQTSQS